MFTFNYRKCTLIWEFNLIKCALNWELALPGKSGYEISPFVFSIRHILKNPEVICLKYAIFEISTFSLCILIKICHSNLTYFIEVLCLEVDPFFVYKTIV